MVHAIPARLHPDPASPIAAQTTFSATDLDSNGDGKVLLTKARDGFKVNRCWCYALIWHASPTR